MRIHLTEQLLTHFGIHPIKFSHFIWITIFNAPLINVVAKVEAVHICSHIFFKNLGYIIFGFKILPQGKAGKMSIIIVDQIGQAVHLMSWKLTQVLDENTIYLQEEILTKYICL